MSAPELKIKINGTVIGYCTAFTYRSSQGQKMTFGVDSPFPQEIAQGASPSFVEGTMELIRPKGGNPESWNFMTPRLSTDGKVEDGNLTSTALGSAKYSVLEVYDRASDTLMIKIGYVMFGTQSWAVGVKDVMKGTVSFQGIMLQHNNKDETSGSFF
jgi:hypothetical protein